MHIYIYIHIEYVKVHQPLLLQPTLATRITHKRIRGTRHTFSNDTFSSNWVACQRMRLYKLLVVYSEIFCYVNVERICSALDGHHSGSSARGGLGLLGLV